MYFGRPQGPNFSFNIHTMMNAPRKAMSRGDWGEESTRSDE